MFEYKFESPLQFSNFNGDVVSATQNRIDLVEDDIDLAEYIGSYKNSIKSKIESIFVEAIYKNGKGVGVATTVAYEKLNKVQIAELIGYISGQYSDGWGEGFEQEDLFYDDEGLFCSFWNFPNSGWKLEMISEKELDNNNESC